MLNTDAHSVTQWIHLSVLLLLALLLAACGGGGGGGGGAGGGVNSNNLWTWVSGSNTNDQGGTYGAQGTADATNVPGARAGAISWADASGDLWLFGGLGYDGVGTFGYLNDLWRWDGTQWTWVSGSNTYIQSGTYGIQGTADAANVPGARYDSMSWTDASGDLWMFGGYGLDVAGGFAFGNLNDLWRWDGTQWTWISGSNTRNQPGTYGTQGIADAANVPGARSSAMSWTDASGDLWLFGGGGYDSAGTFSYLNDLWRWDGTQWTWVSGSNTVHQSGIYGTQGIADAANEPGARAGAISWTDASSDQWLFGGFGYDSAGNLGHLNDLWRWDGTQWTWISGSNTVDQSGTFGTQGIADAANVPGARRDAVSWIDTSGDLWLFGGYETDSYGTYYLNDLWHWDGTNWTWISGSNTVNQSGAYGTQGITDAANVPGARRDAVSWTDASGDLWLFGGFGHLNDLWRYQP